MTTVTTGVNLDITCLVNPQFSITAVEASAPQVVGSSLPPFEKFAVPVYNQVHQEQIVAGETTQNIVEFPAVQEQVIFQEISQVPIVEWIPEQIVGTIGVLSTGACGTAHCKTNCARASPPDPRAECRHQLD